MRLLINISNNIGGGSFQVAHSFVQECKKYSMNEYIVVVNSKVYQLFDIESFPSNFKFLCIKNNSFITLAKKMKVIETRYNPDVVFTVFGPSYWKSNAPQVVGFANPYYILIDRSITVGLKKCFSSLQYLLIRMKKIIHTFYMNHEADVIIAETKYCTEEFLKMFKKVKKGYTVSNTYSSFFEKAVLPIKHEKFVLLTVSKYYKHKNLEIINEVCKELSKKKISDIEFMLTLDENNYKRLFSHNPYVVNVGYTAPQDCPSLYAKADVMFLPTLAECFSASYPEAMKSRIPIITSDFEFAHSICNDAALYIDPFNPKDIVDKIITIKTNKQLYDSLIQKGECRINSFPVASKRCEKYLEICTETMLEYRK